MDCSGLSWPGGRFSLCRTARVLRFASWDFRGLEDEIAACGRRKDVLYLQGGTRVAALLQGLASMWRRGKGEKVASLRTGCGPRQPMAIDTIWPMVSSYGSE